MNAGILHMHDAKRWQQAAPAVARAPAPARKLATKRAQTHR
jgi:hypothetical protein